jgi:hypothetical protein
MRASSSDRVVSAPSFFGTRTKPRVVVLERHDDAPAGVVVAYPEGVPPPVETRSLLLRRRPRQPPPERTLDTHRRPSSSPVPSLAPTKAIPPPSVAHLLPQLTAGTSARTMKDPRDRRPLAITLRRSPPRPRDAPRPRHHPPGAAHILSSRPSLRLASFSAEGKRPARTSPALLDGYRRFASDQRRAHSRESPPRAPSEPPRAKGRARRDLRLGIVLAACPYRITHSALTSSPDIQIASSLRLRFSPRTLAGPRPPPRRGHSLVHGAPNKGLSLSPPRSIAIGQTVTAVHADRLAPRLPARRTLPRTRTSLPAPSRLMHRLSRTRLPNDPPCP